jgi:alkylation response protein AidB-like acyl-CoA dehydrogenase
MISEAERDELRRSVRRFLDERSPVAAARTLAVAGDSYDPLVWRQLADELGLLGLAVPEEHGGSGASFAELGVVLEEMGASLLCAPYLATTVLAAQALLASGDTQACADWMPAIAEGSLVATLAVTREDGVSSATEPSVRAELIDGTWRLTGVSEFVLDGDSAALVLVAALAEAGPTLFAVSADGPGLSAERHVSLDLTRRLARVELADCPARLVGAVGAAGPVLRRVLDLATVALACEQLGGARRCLDMMVGYATTRSQFGRPIGSFQAIKHSCADVLVQVESARSAVTWALGVADDPEELPVAAALVGAWCAETYTTAAAKNIQLHGGIGYTWEHDAHLYFRRAKSDELLLGQPDDHRDRLADLIGL